MVIRSVLSSTEYLYLKSQNLPVKSMQCFHKFLEEYLLNCAHVGCDSQTWTTSANLWTHRGNGFCLFSVCSPSRNRESVDYCVYYSSCFSVYDLKLERQSTQAFQRTPKTLLMELFKVYHFILPLHYVIPKQKHFRQI